MTSANILRLWTFLCITCLAANAAGQTPQTLSPLSDEPAYPLLMGTTWAMQRDWQQSTLELMTPSRKPDRSFRSIWVRIFPLVSLPLGDPYMNTEDYNHVSMGNSGYLQVFEMGTERLIGRGKLVELDFSLGTIKIDGRAFVLGPAWVSPETSITTTMTWDNGKVRSEMRGGFVVKKSVHVPRDLPVPRELWSVINVLPVNDYLRSVVPSEVIASWNRETLRAQAIAARTYGMFEMAVARAQGLDFDVDPSTWYQSYQGYKFWNRTTNSWRVIELGSTSDAVTATKGEVILYNGEVIKAYFSSNSGGHTCLVTECLEQDYNPPYIAEVDDHPKIRSSPGGTWGTRATLTSDQIRKVLIEQGLNPPGTVKRLNHLEKGPSGRTWRLSVSFQNGTTLELDRLQTRKIMHLYGPIRSFLYQLGSVQSDGKQDIKGYGYGHAVGMSQWGAQLYAKDGWTAHRILQHFYHQVTIKDMTNGLL